MTGPAEWRAWLADVDHAGGCVHPVRLAGGTLDRATGELSEGVVAVACKDRRAAVCPACAARYRADAWHLVAAGLRGGKGVPPEVALHPAVFATLTAPSFGPVHTARAGPCRPRRAPARCPHGVVLSCGRRHHPDDPVVGEPLCAGCFDYEGAVLWNAHLGALWDRTAVLARRRLARAGGAGDSARLSYLKVAEFQRRGLVHLHLVVRIDGADGPAAPPPPWCGTGLVAGVLADAATAATAARLDGGPRVRWGTELDTRAIGATAEDAPGPTGEGDPGTVAAYLAKYTTKSSEHSGALAHRLGTAGDLGRLHLRPHVVRLVETAWALGDRRALAPLRLRDHAHTFGYRGHFATKSRRYSTTFAALRAARAAHRRAEAAGADHDTEATWRYAGRGYASPEAARLAEALAEAAGNVPGVPVPVPR